MSNLLTTVLEVVGIGIISVGAWTFGTGFGLVATGLALIAVSWSLSR